MHYKLPLTCRLRLLLKATSESGQDVVIRNVASTDPDQQIQLERVSKSQLMMRKIRL